MRIVKLFCIATVSVAFLLPLLQLSFEPFPRVGLSNVRIERRLPSVTLDHLLEGSFQKKLEKWFLRNHGLWGTFVRSANQVNYSIFEQISGSYGTSAVMGNDKTLVQRTYIDELNGRILEDTDKLRSRIERVSALEKFMRDNGKAFLIVVSTNKAAFYPEWFPGSFHSDAPMKRDIEFVRPLLVEKQIETLDSFKYLKARTNESEYPFFTRSGSHWNSVANCWISKEILERIAAQLEKPVRSIACGPSIAVHPQPVKRDRDLVKMINVWDASGSKRETPYIEVSSNLEEPVFKPKVLFVGTSFFWAITDLLERQRAYTVKDLFFYGKTNYFYRGERTGNDMRGQVPIQYEGVNWQEKLLSYDAIVLEANEAIIAKIGFNFLDYVSERTTPP